MLTKADNAYFTCFLRVTNKRSVRHCVDSLLGPFGLWLLEPVKKAVEYITKYPYGDIQLHLPRKVGLSLHWNSYGSDKTLYIESSTCPLRLHTEIALLLHYGRRRRINAVIRDVIELLKMALDTQDWIDISTTHENVDDLFRELGPSDPTYNKTCQRLLYEEKYSRMFLQARYVGPYRYINVVAQHWKKLKYKPWYVEEEGKENTHEQSCGTIS